MILKRIYFYIFKFNCTYKQQNKTANKGGVYEANNGITPIERGKPLPIGKKKTPSLMIPVKQAGKARGVIKQSSFYLVIIPE